MHNANSAVKWFAFVKLYTTLCILNISTIMRYFIETVALIAKNTKLKTLTSFALNN